MSEAADMPALLPPETPITRANLAQALAELMADLPDGSSVKPGALYVNGGLLAAAPKD